MGKGDACVPEAASFSRRSLQHCQTLQIPSGGQTLCRSQVGSCTCLRVRTIPGLCCADCIMVTGMAFRLGLQTVRFSGFFFRIGVRGCLTWWIPSAPWIVGTMSMFVMLVAHATDVPSENNLPDVRWIKMAMHAGGAL